MVSRRQRLHMGVATFAMALLGVAAPSQAHPTKAPAPEILPTIFVHGFAGSAAQYQSQAMRFASNGVPDERILAFEYNTGSAAGIGAAPAALDALVDQTRTRFGVERVNLVAHSLGTAVSGIYLSNPARAAKISKYIGVDGASNATCGSTAPGTLSCMGIFRGSTGNVGGRNVFFNDTQTHVQTITSPESFAAQFEFLTGVPPRTTDILDDPGLIDVAGRVVNFPANTGAEGATLELWRISGRNGERRIRVHSAALGADGSWGPFRVLANRHYELAVQRDDAVTGHFYFQPWPRSTFLVRMNVAAPGAASTANTNVSDHHAALVITRQKEFWVNHPSGQNDRLTIETRGRRAGSQDPVEVLLPVTDNSRIAIHVHDDVATPEVSSLALLPFFPTQPFQTGVDVFMPASTPPDGSIRIINAHRGNGARRDLQIFNIPNWASATDRVSISFNDYLQDARGDSEEDDD